MKLTKKERGHIKGRISKARVVFKVEDTSLYFISDVLSSSTTRPIDFSGLSVSMKNLNWSV